MVSSTNMIGTLRSDLMMYQPREWETMSDEMRRIMYESVTEIYVQQLEEEYEQKTGKKLCRQEKQ